jgi:hypothetical protein
MERRQRIGRVRFGVGSFISSVAKLLPVQWFLCVDFEVVEALVRTTGERNSGQKKSEAVES